MRKSPLILLTGVVLASCAPTSVPPVAAPTSTIGTASSAPLTPQAGTVTFEPDKTQEESIREVVIRDLLKGAGPSRVYFVGCHDFFRSENDADSSDAFLARFADLKLRIRKLSDSTTVKSKNDKSQFVFDRASGDPGCIIGAATPRWIDQNKAEVDASVYAGKLNATGTRYVVERKGGKWIVVERVHTWSA